MIKLHVENRSNVLCEKNAFVATLFIALVGQLSSGCSLGIPSEDELFGTQGGSGGNVGTAGSGGTGNVSGASGSGGSAGGVAGASSADPSLLLHYEFDETDGTVVSDSSGHAADGTTVNAPVWVTGQTGNGLELHASASQYVELPKDILKGLSSATVAFWVQLEDTAARQHVFDFGNDENNAFYFSPSEGAQTTVTSLTVGGDPQLMKAILLASTVNLNHWKHVAVVWSPPTASYFVDGQQVVGSLTPASLTHKLSDLGSTSNNWIGRSQSSTDTYLTAVIDDFRLYGRALNAVEIAKLSGSK